jgi:hypothetical protein
MTHLDEGTIVALRDGALVTGDAREHLNDCGICRTGVTEAQRRAERIASSLSKLDLPVTTDRAKVAVRARLDAQPSRNLPRARLAWRHVGRAAAVLLVAAGAAYAIPGSPARTWLEGPERVRDATESPAAGTQERSSRTGIVVNVPDGRIRVELTGLSEGSELQVVWTAAATARISAEPGSSFSFAEGVAQATVTPGPVQVELPRFAPVVSIDVDGRTYLRRASGGLEVLEPAVERTEDFVRFLIPER